MLFDVQFWIDLTHFSEPDIVCRVVAVDVEAAAINAMRLYDLASVAYASVDMVTPVTGMVIARSWGPVVREVC